MAPEQSDDGVDLTLIRWMLSLTPQNLAVLQDQVDSLLTLRAKFESQVLEILKVLTRHRIDFIVVGGVSAVLHGAPGHQLLLTKFGPLDVLGMIGKSRTWEDLGGHTRTMEIEPGVALRVLDLETLIALKEELGFPKNVAVLPVLRQALKELSERER